MRQEQIYQEIVNRILTLKLVPGQPVSAASIAKELGVSITPVREVFIKLALEKLIEVYPQSGTFVSHIDLEYAQQMVFMRSVLEREIVFQICNDLKGQIPREVVKNLSRQKEAIKEKDILSFLDYDNGLHRLLFKIAGHEMVWDAIERSKLHYVRIRLLDTSQPHAMERIFREHQLIVDLIRAQDKAELEKLLRRHLYFDFQSDGSFIERYSEYFVNKGQGTKVTS